MELTKIGLLYENIYCTDTSLEKREELINKLDFKTFKKLKEQVNKERKW